LKKEMNWPDGKQSAAMVTIELDNEYIWSAMNVDFKKPKCRSMGTYGLLRGLDRLLDSLDEHRIKATFFIPGIVAEVYPEKVSQVDEKGHEIALHGYAHENFAMLTPAEQETALKKGIAALKKVTGKTPFGFRLPEGNSTPETIGIINDAGFLYDSSLFDGDLPYQTRINGAPVPLIEIPIRWELQDFPYFAFNSRPAFPAGGSRVAIYGSVLENWLYELDAYYDMGLCYVIKFDPQTIGSPGRISLFNEVLANIAKKNIWAATGNEIAAHFRRQQSGRPES